MAIVLQFAGFDPQDLRLTVSPLAELMAVLHAMAEPDHHFDAAESIAGAAAALDPRHLEEFRVLSPLWARFRCRLFFPLESGPSKTLESELDMVAALPLEAFVALAAEAIEGAGRDLPTPERLVNDLDARRDFLEMCRKRSVSRFELADQLLRAPEAFRERLLDFCRTFAEEFFSRQWRDLSIALGRAGAQLSGRLRTTEPVDVLATLSTTAKAFPGVLEVRFDKLQQDSVPLAGRQLVLVPSVWIGNHLTIKDTPGYPVVVHFPAPQPSRERLRIRQIRDRLSALSAESRMELFRHIAAEPMTTSELALRLGQQPAQISRQLGILRGAGLVLSERHGKLVYHRIDTGAVLALGPDLLSTLTR